MRYIVITLGIFLVLSSVVYGHMVDCEDESENSLAQLFSKSQKILICLCILFCFIAITDGLLFFFLDDGCSEIRKRIFKGVKVVIGDESNIKN